MCMCSIEKKNLLRGAIEKTNCQKLPPQYRYLGKATSVAKGA